MKRKSSVFINKKKIVLSILCLFVAGVLIYYIVSVIQLNFSPKVNVTFNDIDIPSVTKIEVQTFDHSKILQTITDTKTITNAVEFLKKYNGSWDIPTDNKYPPQDIALRLFYKVGFPNGEDGISFGQDFIISQGAVHKVSKDEIKNLRILLGI